MRRTLVGTALIAGALAIGCSSSTERVDEIRAALDKAELSLSDSVAAAEASSPETIGVDAKLLIRDEPVFSVDALSGEALENFRIDIVSGEVLSVEASSGSATSCDGGITLGQAIAAAEKEVGGEAFSVESEDEEGPCIREVSVLAGDTVYEVEVSKTGSILEVEESDDFGEDEEDDADD